MTLKYFAGNSFAAAALEGCFLVAFHRSISNRLFPPLVFHFNKRMVCHVTLNLQQIVRGKQIITKLHINGKLKFIVAHLAACCPIAIYMSTNSNTAFPHKSVRFHVRRTSQFVSKQQRHGAAGTKKLICKLLQIPVVVNTEAPDVSPRITRK